MTSCTFGLIAAPLAAGAGTGLCLLKEGLQAYFIQQLLGSHGLPLTPAHLLYLCTRAGAQALGLGVVVGDLSVNKAFDAIWLKPRDGTDFGTTEQWRHYNSLYFPYVVGVRAYAQNATAAGLDPVSRQAWHWLVAEVPQRSLHNWQNAAARVIATDLRSNLAPVR